VQREYKKHRPWTNENSSSPQLAGFDVLEISSGLARGLRCHPTRPGAGVQNIRGSPRMVRDEPFRGCLGLFAIISWIDELRMIWMLVTRAESRGEGAERLILEVSVATFT
jgi:hypothetical protein